MHSIDLVEDGAGVRRVFPAMFIRARLIGLIQSHTDAVKAVTTKGISNLPLNWSIVVFVGSWNDESTSETGNHW
eukprot:scaffold24447_cov150-Skeletonema_dohrnii-CCMP3373.AAC.4